MTKLVPSEASGCRLALSSRNHHLTAAFSTECAAEPCNTTVAISAIGEYFDFRCRGVVLVQRECDTWVTNNGIVSTA